MAITLTQRDLITRALRSLGVYGPTETPSAEDMRTGQDLLAELIDNWNTQALTVLNVERHVYAIDGTKGGPNDPYTLGPGGDWDTGTAARPVLIRNAALAQTSSSPTVEIPLPVITGDMYAAQAIKGQTNPLPSWLYYNATVPLGQVFLWNIPTETANFIVLYTDALVAQFADLSSQVVLPAGSAKAFRLCLARDCITSFAVPNDIAAQVRVDAEQALLDFKMANVPMADLMVDPAYTPSPHGTYVIQTDQGA